MRFALLLALQSITLAPIAGQSVLYLDPTTGIDAPGGGSANQPLRTLTFAVGQARGATTFRLRAGNYTTASGETFPIALPDVCVVEADPATVPSGSGLVVITADLGLTSTFWATPAGTANITLRELTCTGGMFRAVRLDVAAGAAGSLTLERCDLAQSRCVVVNAAAGATASVALRDCQLAGVDTPVTVATSRLARIDLGIDRCTVRNGLRSALFLDASAGGDVRLVLRHSRVGLAESRLIYAATDQGGTASTRIEHCLLHDVGTRTIGGTVGAIIDTVGTTGQLPQHTIVNSLLHRNRSDAPAGLGANYTWGTNFVGQANLAGVGGNVVATAQFVDEAGSDYHLTPISPGLDAARRADLTATTDLDGDPYLGAPDLGPDEAHFAYLAGPTRALLGRTLTLRPLIAPQAPFALLLATAATPTFGAGQLHLTGTIVDAGLLGACDARGVGQLALAVPANRFLHRVALHWQAFTIASPFAGANARRTVFVQP